MKSLDDLDIFLKHVIQYKNYTEPKESIIVIGDPRKAKEIPIENFLSHNIDLHGVQLTIDTDFLIDALSPIVRGLNDEFKKMEKQIKNLENDIRDLEKK